MPKLSHLHQRFSAEPCQSSIRTLRWQARPLQWPRCPSQDVSSWGTYYDRPGCKRSWCHGCRRTFNDLTHT
jgi:transposase-like protein